MRIAQPRVAVIFEIPEEFTKYALNISISSSKQTYCSPYNLSVNFLLPFGVYKSGTKIENLKV